MIAPAFWYTILVTNCAIMRYNVPREIVQISTVDLDFSAMTKEELLNIASPREKRNGELFYLSNGIVSWLNCVSIDYEDISLSWDGEIKLLKDCGLQFGRDMVRVQWYTEKQFYTCVEHQIRVVCPWVDMIEINKVWDSIEALDKASGYVNSCALLWVNANKIFKGYDIRRIKT